MRIELPSLTRPLHELRLAIRWGDMDALGHVNNVAYFGYLETARIEWMSAAGFHADPHGESFVIVNTFCNFMAQIQYPGDLLLKTYAMNPGRSSVDSFTTIERVDSPGHLCAAGGATIVWMDLPKQKSIPLPARLRDLLA